MRTVCVTCDRCKAEIREGRALLKAESGRMRQAMPELDLCAGCEAALFMWLSCPPGDEPSDRAEIARDRSDFTR